MDKADRGRKRICSGCATKSYDFGVPQAACPNCGSVPPPRKPAPATRRGPARSAPLRRYP